MAQLLRNAAPEEASFKKPLLKNPPEEASWAVIKSGLMISLHHHLSAKMPQVSLHTHTNAHNKLGGGNKKFCHNTIPHMNSIM